MARKRHNWLGQEQGSAEPELIKTATAALTAAELRNHKIIIANKASALTLTIPAATGSYQGMSRYIANKGAGLLTVSVAAGFGGSAVTSFTLMTGQSVVVFCDGLFWYAPADIEDIDTAATLQVPIQQFLSTDLITPLGATGDATILGIVAGAHGTNGPSLQGKDVTGLTATTTDLARTLLAIPADYVAGTNLTIRLHAGMLTTVADTTCTVDVQAYIPDEEAGISADLCATAATSINSLTLADKDFTITGTTIAAGDIIDLELTTVSVHTGTATATIPIIGAVKLIYSAQ